MEEANKEISDMTTLIITKDKRIFNLGEEIESKQVIISRILYIIIKTSINNLDIWPMVFTDMSS